MTSRGRFDNGNRGSMNPNADKQQPGANPNWADWKGQVTIDGKEYWLDAWEKTGPKGRWLSVSARPKQVRDHAGGSDNPPARRASEFDRDPF